MFCDFGAIPSFLGNPVHVNKLYGILYFPPHIPPFVICLQKAFHVYMNKPKLAAVSFVVFDKCKNDLQSIQQFVKGGDLYELLICLFFSHLFQKLQCISI